MEDERLSVSTGDGVILSATAEGPTDGPVVLAVHGFASSAQANWRSAGWSRALTAEGYRLITFDQRGHGESDKPHDAARYRPAVLRSDALAVLDACDARQAHWLGYSFGARLGIDVAREAPTRILSLSLGGLPSRDPFTAFDLDAARRSVLDGTPVADPVSAEFVRAMTMPGNDPLALFRFVEGVRSEQPHDPLEIPTAPMLLVAGDQDAVATDSAWLAERTGARFLALTGRTHANAISARGFKEAVTTFLATLPGS